MKSVEAKVAAAVAVCFALLSLCAIAQEQSQHGSTRPDGSGINAAPQSLQVSSNSLSTGVDGQSEVLGLY